MKPHVSVHLDSSTQIEVNTMPVPRLSGGAEVCVKVYPRGDRYNGLDAFMSWERLRRLYSAIGAALSAHGQRGFDEDGAIDESDPAARARWESAWRGEPDGGSDRVDITPAEAVTGVWGDHAASLAAIDQEVS